MTRIGYSEEYLMKVAETDPELAQQLRDGTLGIPQSGDEKWMATDVGLTEAVTLTNEEARAFERLLRGS